MQATGILIDGPLLRWATLKKKSKGLAEVALKTEADTQIVKEFYTHSAPLISGLSSSDLIIRSLPLSLAPNRKLRGAVILQVEADLPFQPEEMITLALLDGKKKQAATFTTTKSALDTHLAAFSHLRLDPERVGGIPVALQSFVSWKAPELHSYFVVDIGMSVANAVWVENGMVRQAHAIKGGFLELKQASLEDRKKMITLRQREEIDFSLIRMGGSPALLDKSRNFRKELSRLLYSFQCQRPIVFTGQTDPLFREFLLESLQDIVQDEIKLDMTVEEGLYAIPLGLAADYLTHTEQPLQFRKDGAISGRVWQRLGRYAVGLFLMSLLLCLTVYSSTSSWMEKREQAIVRNLEAWVIAKDPALRLELFSVGDRTEDLVNQWLKIIEKNAKNYPFFVHSPRVAHVLNWLFRHPLIESFQAAGDAVSFEQIRYQLETFPHLGAMREPYLAKVELDFKVKSPMHARQLHQMILQGEGIVDATRDITWEALSDRYRTSFYLKNVNNAIF